MRLAPRCLLFRRFAADAEEIARHKTQEPDPVGRAASGRRSLGRQTQQDWESSFDCQSISVDQRRSSSAGKGEHDQSTPSSN